MELKLENVEREYKCDIERGGGIIWDKIVIKEFRGNSGRKSKREIKRYVWEINETRKANKWEDKRRERQRKKLREEEYEQKEEKSSEWNKEKRITI